MKPLILLTGGTGAAANGTPTWALNQNYAENIRRAGGIPILAVNNDCAEEYADLADGLLLSGGKDVEPKLYGQEKMFDFVITDPQRDDLEYKIIKAFVDRKKPIWGICRGIQILNVYFGGTPRISRLSSAATTPRESAIRCASRVIPFSETSTESPWK